MDRKVYTDKKTGLAKRALRSATVVTSWGLALGTVGWAADSVTNGGVVNSKRSELCRFADTNSLGSTLLKGVNCQIYQDAKKPQASNQFTTRGMEELGTWLRFDSSKANRDRAFGDSANAGLKADVVTRVILPAIASAESIKGSNGKWTVTGPGGKPLDISGIQALPIMGSLDKDPSSSVYNCPTDIKDPKFKGCVDFTIHSGLWNNFPVLGSDNKDNVGRAMLHTWQADRDDVKCPVNNVLAPAFTLDDKTKQLTEHETMSVWVRSHIREVLFQYQGVMPWDVNVLIDDSLQYSAGVDVNTAYAKDAQQHGYMADGFRLNPDYCNDNTTVSINESGPADLHRIALMGQTTIQPNSFDPFNL